MAEGVEIGSVWRYKNGRHPHVRYRVVARGMWRYGLPWVLIERDDLLPKRRRSRQPEGWLLRKLERADEVLDGEQ